MRRKWEYERRTENAILRTSEYCGVVCWIVFAFESIFNMVTCLRRDSVFGGNSFSNDFRLIISKDPIYYCTVDCVTMSFAAFFSFFVRRSKNSPTTFSFVNFLHYYLGGA